jgi:hypothetical protein
MKFLTTAISTPLGIIVLGVMIIAVFILIIILVKNGYAFGKDEHGHWSFKPREKSRKDEGRRPINNIQIINDLDEILSNTDERIKDLQAVTLKEINRIQKEALDRAIATIVLEFSEQPVESKRDPGELVMVLQLYLERDLTKIVIEKLDGIRNSPSFLKKSETDIMSDVSQLTSDCIDKMKIQLKTYIIIGDQKSLVQLFENSRRNLTNTLEVTLKNFLKTTKEEQDKKLELLNLRSTKITEKIKSFCEE